MSSESQSRTLPAFTGFVNMALSKIGLRKRQDKGKACFNVGLNFPEKHAMHLKSYLQCIIITLNRVIFLTVLIKVKTLKSLLTITDRLTNRQKDRVCVHNISPTPTQTQLRLVIKQNTTRFFLNTTSIVVVPPDKYCHLQGLSTSKN